MVGLEGALKPTQSQPLQRGLPGAPSSLALGTSGWGLSPLWETPRAGAARGSCSVGLGGLCVAGLALWGTAFSPTCV